MNKRIRFLRGASDNIAKETTKTLAPGQPLYNIDKNYLTIGSLDRYGQEQPLSQLPITVRELHGFYADNDSITKSSSGQYRIGPTVDGHLEIKAENYISCYICDGAGHSVSGGMPMLEVTPSHVWQFNSVVHGNFLTRGGTTLKFGEENQVYTRIHGTSIDAIAVDNDVLRGGVDLTINAEGGDVSLGKNTSDIIITGRISDGTNETTVENIVTKTGNQTITGEKKFDNIMIDVGGGDYRRPLATPITEQSTKCYLVTVDSIYAMHSNYHGEVYTENGKLYSKGSEVVNLISKQTITGEKTFSALGTFNSGISSTSASLSGSLNCASATVNGTLNVHTINLIID